MSFDEPIEIDDVTMVFPANALASPAVPQTT